MDSANYAPDSLASIRRVAIWGASRSGIHCLSQLENRNIEVEYFIDKLPPEDGSIGGITIHNVRYINDNPTLLSVVDCVILAMSSDSAQPRLHLEKLGFSKPIINFREGASVEKLFNGQLSINHMFAYDYGIADTECLGVLADEIKKNAPAMIYGAGRLTSYLVESCGDIKDYITAIIDDDTEKVGQKIGDFFIRSPSDSLNKCQSIFIASTHYLTIEKLLRKTKRQFGEEKKRIRVTDLKKLMTTDKIPLRAWRSPVYSIYPIDIPPIEFKPDLDFVLLDLPARFLGMMPNGLGYVHNILKNTGIRFQTMDLDMIIYHRYHSQRILDGLDEVKTKNGYLMQQEPWTLEVVEEEWKNEEVLAYFQPDIDELIEELINKAPKMLGLSLHSSNLFYATQVVTRLKLALPDLIVIVGGFDCNRSTKGQLSFLDYDYMVVFEAESTLGELVIRIMAGERPKNMPGVVSKYDEPSFPFIPAALIEDLDSLDFPRYDWTEIDLYRNYNGYQLTPIVLSRGCRWSLCNFCAERFPWRRRSPINMVDEIEWLAEKGCSLFHFNDSDLSGDPLAVRGVCEEIIRRGLTGLSFVGQLRVQKGYTQDYFHILKKAGFINLRYGVDGWAKNTLKLHKKGYTLDMIKDVLSFTRKAGIGVSINLVIGIPSERETDIDETIENLVKYRELYDAIENINTLILAAGSVYWEEPEKHGIKFVGDKNELYKQHPRMIPDNYWFSDVPYIDQNVRKERLQRIIDAANDAEIPIGNYAELTIKRLGARSNSQ